MSTFLAEGSGVNMPIQQWPFAIGQEDPVLVVDDQVVMGDLTRRLLARLGFENSSTRPTATTPSHYCATRSTNSSFPICTWRRWAVSNS